MQTFMLHVQHMRLTRAGQIIALVLGLLTLLAPSTGTHASQQSALADLPPAAQSLVSTTLGRDDAVYHFQSTDEGYGLPNASDDLRIDWSKTGMQIQSDKAQWAMGLRAIGYGDAREPVNQVAPSANANRLEYVHDIFTEWYVNGPAGLEQGWTLTSPPSPLLKDAVYVFVKPSGGWATTLIPTATLTIAWGNSDDFLGGSVAISADGATIVAGATGVSVGGAAYVFVKPGGGWATTGFYHARLIENNAYGDNFGASVATNGDGTIIAVGAD